MNLVIPDQLPTSKTFPTKGPGSSATVTTQPDFQDPSKSRSAPTQSTTTLPTTTQQTTAATKPVQATIKPTELTTNIPPTTIKPMTVRVTTAPQQTTTTIQPTMDSNQHTTSPLNTNIGSPIEESPLVESQAEPKSRLSWTESPADQPKTTKQPGRQTYNTVIYLVVSAHILGLLSLQQGKDDNHTES